MFRRLRRSEEGQSLVEFVVLLPLVLYMIFVFGDYSRVYYSTRLLDERFNQVPIGEYYSTRDSGGNLVPAVRELDSDVAYVGDKSREEMELILNNMVVYRDPWLHHNIVGDIDVERSKMVRRPGGSYDEVEAVADVSYRVRSLRGKGKDKIVKRRVYTFRYVPK